MRETCKSVNTGQILTFFAVTAQLQCMCVGEGGNVVSICLWADDLENAKILLDVKNSMLYQCTMDSYLYSVMAQL